MGVLRALPLQEFRNGSSAGINATSYALFAPGVRKGLSSGANSLAINLTSSAESSTSISVSPAHTILLTNEFTVSFFVRLAFCASPAARNAHLNDGLSETSTVVSELLSFFTL